MFRKQSSTSEASNSATSYNLLSLSAAEAEWLEQPLTPKSATTTFESPTRLETQNSQSQSNFKSTMSPPQKEKEPPAKRRKVVTTSKITPSTPGKQKTLQNFFQPKQTSSKVQIDSKAPLDTQNDLPESSTGLSSHFVQNSNSIDPDHRNTTTISPQFSPLNIRDDIEDAQTGEMSNEFAFADPEDTKLEWTKIFSKRDPPRCEGHKEPGTNLETKRKGANCGRRFWICARYVCSLLLHCLSAPVMGAHYVGALAMLFVTSFCLFEIKRGVCVRGGCGEGEDVFEQA
jgi:hypothetical protein